jgi:phosphatidate cytidylyltransferase
MADNSKSRTGRNLPAATAVGLVLGALVLLTLLLEPWTFVLLALAAIILGVSEVQRALTGRRPNWLDLPLYAGTGTVIAVAYWYGIRGLLIAIGISVWVILVARLISGPAGYARDATAAVMTLLYLPFMAGFIMLMLAAPDGAHRVLVLIIFTVGNDVGGYAVGSLLGQHRIAPSISPKKSWEGLLGSAIAQVALGAWLFPWLLHLHWWQGVIAGLVLTVSGIVGDLVASSLKRDLGIKDFGTILPGHGGLTDRLDSLVFNAVPLWLLLNHFLGS